ncbi:MAG: hypothetical protein ACP5R4_03010, partial [Armatimonadota bacterium]
TVNPKLPAQCPEMGVSGLLYRGTVLDVKAGPRTIAFEVKTQPVDPIKIALTGTWQMVGTGKRGSRFALDRVGQFVFARVD